MQRGITWPMGIPTIVQRPPVDWQSPVLPTVWYVHYLYLKLGLCKETGKESAINVDQFINKSDVDVVK